MNMIKQEVTDMAHPDYNSKLTAISQTLRKEMTPEEKKLWYQFLRHRSETIYRQKVIGNYIVDFYVASHKLVIELDGIQHTSSEHKQHEQSAIPILPLTVSPFCVFPIIPSITILPSSVKPFKNTCKQENNSFPFCLSHRRCHSIEEYDDIHSKPSPAQDALHPW